VGAGLSTLSKRLTHVRMPTTSSARIASYTVARAQPVLYRLGRDSFPIAVVLRGIALNHGDCHSAFGAADELK
jgi:hypothetical protein